MFQVIEHLITVFFSYFAIMNPLANTAVFVGLTSHLSTAEKARVARRSLMLTFTIILVFAALGKAIFHFFGITLPALRLTGGILVFIIGYHMLHGESSALHDSQHKNPDNLAVSPLAVPILAGPGTIAATMSFAASGGWFEVVSTIAVFLILCLITFFCFVFGDRLVRLIGNNGLQIITRLMGLILAVIGVQMFIEGAFGAFKKMSVVSSL